MNVTARPREFAYDSPFDLADYKRFRLMPLFILGINHNTAPVEVREQVVFAPTDIPRVLSDLRAATGLAECMVLSTCNRTEIIGAGDQSVRHSVREWFGRAHALDEETLAALFELEGEPAARHLFNVASGLDSVVLGEPQIAGQLKDAYRTAVKNGSSGPVLERACQTAFSVAKRVRTNTAIGQNPVSVASAVVRLAQLLLDRFDRQTALLIGAGETIELVAQHLTASGIGRLFIANRNIDNAGRIARQYGGFSLQLSELDGTLPAADIIVASTASPTQIVSHEQMERAVHQRRRQPLFIADIAVPRDIDPRVAELDDIYLYTVDDLHGVITENVAAREEAAVGAAKIVDGAVNRFLESERTLSAVPLIRQLRGQSEQARDEVLAAARRRLEKDGPDAALEFLANSLVQKLLHKPSQALRDAAAASNSDIMESAVKLFGLDDPDNPGNR